MNGNGREQQALAVMEAPVVSAIVQPVVDPAAAKEAWNQYVRLCTEILEEQDYFYYVRYWEGDREAKPVGYRTLAKAEEKVAFLRRLAQYSGVEISKRKKRSAYDKLSRFFGLSVPKLDGPVTSAEITQVGKFVVERRIGEGFSLIVYQDAETLQAIKAVATVCVTAPNGRTEVGEAVCSVSERQRGADSFAHADHDIPTTAFTRAMNRAIGRCIGDGEVSAEEMESEPAGNGGNGGTQVAAPVTAVTEKTSAPAMAEAPKEEKKRTRAKAESPKPVEEPKPQAVVATPDGAYQPLPEGATNSDRITAMQKWLYGAEKTTTRREHQLVKYAVCLFLCITPRIESKPGIWDEKAWHGAVINVSPDARKKAILALEMFAAESTQGEFRDWALKHSAERWGEVKQ